MGLNRLKKKHNRHRILQVFRPVQSHIESVDLEAMDAQIKLEEALAELASQEQRILIMSYREDMSQSKIASELHLPLGTIKSISRRALLKLRKSMSLQTDVQS